MTDQRVWNELHRAAETDGPLKGAQVLDATEVSEMAEYAVWNSLAPDIDFPGGALTCTDQSFSPFESVLVVQQRGDACWVSWVSRLHGEGNQYIVCEIMPLTVDGVISGIAAPSPSRAMYVDLSKAAPANRIFLGIAEIGGAEGERLGVNAAQIAAIFHILNQPGLCEIRDTKHRGRRRKLRRGLGLPTTWKKMHIKPGLVGVRPEDHDAHHGRPLHFVRGYLRRWDGPETDANCFYADGPRGRRLYRRIDGYWRGDRALGLKLHHYTPDPKRGSPCHPARATQNCAPTEEPSR